MSPLKPASRAFTIASYFVSPVNDSCFVQDRHVTVRTCLANDSFTAAWAAAVRLPAATADDIYQRIVITPGPARTISPGLDPAWWRHFTAGFTARMVASTQLVPWTA